MKVAHEEALSSLQPLSADGLQKSVLAPLLNSMYTADIVTIENTVHAIADETSDAVQENQLEGSSFRSSVQKNKKIDKKLEDQL